MDPGSRRHWTWPWRVAGVLAVGAVVGFALAGRFFAGLSDVRTLAPGEGERAIEAALAAGGGNPPWVEINAAGEVRVAPAGTPAASALETLHVVVWDPARSLLVESRLPFWFVRLKTGDAINLGTLVAAAAGDFGHLTLDITTDDLERHGPGVVLDHRRAGGGRVVLWTD